MANAWTTTSKTIFRGGKSADKNAETPPVSPRTPGGQFMKGHSGNPGGRPKKSMRSIMADMLDMSKDELDIFTQKMKKEGKLKDRLIYKFLMAVDKDPMSVLKVIEQLEGKPKESIEFNNITDNLSEMTDAELMAEKKKYLSQQNE